MARTVTIQPAILSKSLPDLGRKLRIARSLHATMVHIDIMDGAFVRNRTVRPQALKTARSSHASYHVMAFHPERYLADLRRAGAREIIVHLEATKKPGLLAAMIHRMGLRFGLAINPRTPIARLRPLMKLADTALVMSVQPGFGGQRFRPSALKRVRALRRMAPRIRIGIDGGIDRKTIRLAAKAGVDFVCAGSAIFGADDHDEAYKRLRREAGSGRARR